MTLYGLFINAAILTALFLGEKWVISRHLNVKLYWKTAFWTLLAGTVGSRAYHVASLWNEYYVLNPSKIWHIWEGGMSFYGALIGGLIGVGLVLKANKASVLPWLDILGLTLPIAQSVGRWGNFFNQELFGKPTTLFIGTYVEISNRPFPYRFATHFHPVFLYESIACVFIFWVVYKISKTSVQPGTLFFMYLGLYSFVRFFLEYLRVDSWQIYGLNVAQSISILLMIFSSYFLYKLNAKSHS